MVNMLSLRCAIEASWKPDTAYLEVFEHDNPALGQCYPTARVVQHFFPLTEIAEGEVWTNNGIEKHFWNILRKGEIEYHIDFSWQQFPHGSYVKTHKVRDREALGDSDKTLKRIALLLDRVNTELKDQQ